MFQAQLLYDYIKKSGMCRVRDAEKNGFRRRDFARLIEDGKIERLSRGLYGVTGVSVGPDQGLRELALRAPDAVVCLISALHFHNLTTQIPRVIWCAIEGTSHAPRISYPPIKIVRFTGDAYSAGVEIYKRDGTPIKVYSVAKTVADLFRFRNKTGIDIAIEALREAIRSRKATRDEIRKMAQVRGVEKIMRPYMEMEAAL
jgi:predicted transcriptional regulator of viral defense system